MSELEIQENMSAEEAFMDTESAYEEIPEAFQKLAQLLGQDQFELLFPDKDVENQDEMRLVYLMNDAVESFLVFSGARMTGHYQKDYEGELDATLSQEDGEYVLVVYQGETVVTIFFQDLSLEMNLYNYGDIGHFWLKGYEYLRILEYRLAILSDKCEYLGEKATSDTERKLAKLVHFPPLNYTCYPAVPAKYIVPMEDPWNPTEEAMDVMEELVKEVGDKSLLWWLQRYRRYHGKRMSRWIARLLQREKHAAVVDLLNKKLAKEAENYPRRDFGEKFNQNYQNILKKAEKRKASQEEKRGKAQKGEAEDHGSGDPEGAAGAMGHCEKGAKDDLSAYPYFTYGDFGGHRRGGPGGHGHSLRKAQRCHVDGDAGTYGAGADAGCAHTPGAGPAGRRDEGAGQSGHYSPDMGPDSHGLCLRRTA